MKKALLKMINRKKSKALTEHFSVCDCHSHILYADYDKQDDTFCLSLFNLGFDGSRLSFKQRLRWCWFILVKGSPFTDMVIISSQKASELATFIKRHSKSFNITHK